MSRTREDNLGRFGFRFGRGGAHLARSMMLDDIPRVEEFELATKSAGHGWELFDLTDTFAEWLSSQRYAKSFVAWLSRAV